MSTATDLSGAIGGNPDVSFGFMYGLTAVDLGISMNVQQVNWTVVMDRLLYNQPIGNVTVDFVPMAPSIESATTTAQDEISAEVAQVAFESVPRHYKMRGYSTTLGQYVYWTSVGDTFTPAPASFGTVINITAEIIA